MLDSLDILAERLDTLSLALRQELVGIVSQAGALLLQFNQDYLAKQGQRPDGEPIQEKGYSAAYARYKAKYGRFTNTAFVDLKFSGDFLNSFVLRYEGNATFRIEATDRKADFLTKYGELLGLRENDINDFVSVILEPALRRFARNYMKP